MTTAYLQCLVIAASISALSGIARWMDCRLLLSFLWLVTCILSWVTTHDISNAIIVRLAPFPTKRSICGNLGDAFEPDIQGFSRTHIDAA
jgi:hypothetical protein